MTKPSNTPARCPENKNRVTSFPITPPPSTQPTIPLPHSNPHFTIKSSPPCRPFPLNPSNSTPFPHSHRSTPLCPVLSSPLISSPLSTLSNGTFQIAHQSQYSVRTSLPKTAISCPYTNLFRTFYQTTQLHARFHHDSLPSTDGSEKRSKERRYFRKHKSRICAQAQVDG